jgi:gas vesicle protein
MSKEGNIDFLKGLLIGGLIGAAIGILYAPKSGKETREQIAKKSDEFLAKAKEEYEKGLEKSKKAYESMLEGMKEVQAETKRKAEEVQEKITFLAETGKETLEENKGRLKRAVEAGIDAFKEEKEKQKI